MADLTHVAENFDYTSPEVGEHLYEVYEHLRQRCPVAHSDAHGGAWIISSYRGVCDAADDFAVFSSAGGTTLPAVGNPVPALPPESDPPIHTAARASIMPYLTPGAVKDYEPYVREVVTSLIDDFVETGEADLVTQFAKPIPAYLVARLFGFSTEDAGRIFGWANAMAEGAGSGDMELVAEGATAYFGFLQGVLDNERAQPTDGIVAAVLSAEVDGRRFTNDECLGILFTTTIGAIETTVNAISHGIKLLCDHPDVRRQLIENPALTAGAVEEILRLEAPAQMLARTVARDIEFGGHDMKVGDRVLLLWGSGNLDPDRFPDPERFDPGRTKNTHLSFGHGIHKCAGMHVARLEIRVAVEEILRRIPDYELTAEVNPIPIGGVAWSLKSLPVRFSPGPRLGPPTN
jgi:hypothetical protein